MTYHHLLRRSLSHTPWLLLIGIATLLPACGWGDEIDTLHAQRDIWERAGGQDYTMVAAIDCFCDLDGFATLRIEGGEIVEVTEPETGAPLTRYGDGKGPTISVAEAQTHYMTVDQLFDEVERLLDHDPSDFSITYHPTLGYPTQVHFHGSRWVGDSGWGATITSLELGRTSGDP